MLRVAPRRPDRSRPCPLTVARRAAGSGLPGALGQHTRAQPPRDPEQLRTLTDDAGFDVVVCASRPARGEDTSADRRASRSLSSVRPISARSAGRRGGSVRLVGRLAPVDRGQRVESSRARRNPKLEGSRPGERCGPRCLVAQPCLRGSRSIASSMLWAQAPQCSSSQSPSRTSARYVSGWPIVKIAAAA